MSFIKLTGIRIKNYRSFGDEQTFVFPKNYGKPIVITGYNNAGKTNLMNSILYGLNLKYVSKDTFSIDDFHNRNIENIPYILLGVDSSTEKKYDGKEANLSGYHKLIIQTDLMEIEGAKISSFNSDDENDVNWQAFGAVKYFPIFYINFHNIKEEIVTQKTSWGNLKSFLGKHIKKLIEEDAVMQARKEDFTEAIKNASKYVFEGKEYEEDPTKEGESKLSKFVKNIKQNYNQNLRDNNIEIDFGLPEYEDIFLQMMFKIGLHGSETNLVPITHFGDGYISMFVMAVIQAIAEDKEEDECLFLFEEPESFLHENHQEYFYKMVLCSLSKKGHQVIYTTHSDKMLDIFDTKGLIRLELEEKDERNGEKSFQTIKKYNNIGDFEVSIDTANEIVTIEKYNQFIKTIEPNLNKILFSKKVLLVEGPNDVLVYKYCIKKIVKEKISGRAEILDKEKWAETYLNFHNISIISHHGKSTVIYLIELCKWFGVDYFVINDWDFEIDFIEKIGMEFESLKSDAIWPSISSEGRSEQTIKSMITTNKNIIEKAGSNKYHFNISKLEKVIGYDNNDKSSIKINNHINNKNFNYKNENLFSQNLIGFLEIDKIVLNNTESKNTEDLPF